MTLFTVQMTTWRFSIILTSKRNPEGDVTVFDVKILFEESRDSLKCANGHVTIVTNEIYI